MGYMRHHAIVVTSCVENIIEEAHAKAEHIFTNGGRFIPGLRGWVSPISPAATNGYRSFFVAPDGSKDGWGESSDADECRAEFISWLDEQRYEDGSTNLKWAEVLFGDDEGHAAIIHHSERHIQEQREAEQPLP